MSDEMAAAPRPRGCAYVEIRHADRAFHRCHPVVTDGRWPRKRRVHAWCRQDEAHPTPLPAGLGF
jgi:hypothetical protein